MISDASTSLFRRLSRGLSTAGTVLLVLVLGVALTACGDDDDGMGPGLSEPEVTGSIDNQSLTTDDAPVEVDISGVFEGDELTFSASSSNSDVASVSLDGNTLTVTPEDGGSATITVTAENDAGSASTDFDANIDLGTPPDPPNGS